MSEFHSETTIPMRSSDASGTLSIAERFLVVTFTESNLKFKNIIRQLRYRIFLSKKNRTCGPVGNELNLFGGQRGGPGDILVDLGSLARCRIFFLYLFIRLHGGRIISCSLLCKRKLH